jgi:hypothetical protein
MLCTQSNVLEDRSLIAWNLPWSSYLKKRIAVLEVDRVVRVEGDRIATARQFVEHVATQSSTSGEPYRIRFADGTVVPLGDYLRDRLDEFERGE